MLKSYEAIYENGQVRWLTEPPQVDAARIIIIIEENTSVPKRRSPSALIAGKGRTLGDIVSPIINEEDWECLK